jgi:hypothetical protein
MKDSRQIMQALKRPTYWINITGISKLFRPLVSQLRKTLRTPGDAPIVFVTYFHPDELLRHSNPLYHLESVRPNLESALRVCEEAGARVEFVRAKDIPRLLP